jgi:exodeoxyribonuclease VII large subunit
MGERWLFGDDEADETPGVPAPAAPRSKVTRKKAKAVVEILETETAPEPEPPPPPPPEPAVLTVSELTAAIQGTLQAGFSSISVSGEISEISRPHSGHVYFTLKDENAQIKAILWRSAAQRLRFKLEEGQEVICHGDLDVYPPRGTYQLIVQRIEPQGIGALQLAFQQLHMRLAAEGLFDPARKRQLPRFPRRIGFVTSPSGAAIHDFLQVIRRRFRGVHVFVIPAKVQGEGAAADVVRGIELANRMRPSLDVLVVGRGGGSIEDLWCFNEEPVLRAIHASRVPVVSAVGHEVDVTLADLVADVRALTPTEAAERIVPSTAELRDQLAGYSRRMKASLLSQLASARRHLELLATRRVLTHPLDRIHERSRRLDELAASMDQALQRRLQRNRDQLRALAAQLESLSPLRVLSRGYTVTQRLDGRVVRDASELQLGETIRTRCDRGEILSRVESTPPSSLRDNG